METLRRAIGNTGLMLLSQGVTWVATLTLTAALGRHLGDEGFGELYLAISYGALFGILVEFGLNQHLVRAIARDRSLAAAYLANAIAIKAVFAAVAYAVILAIASTLGYSPRLKLTLAVLSFGLLFSGLSSSFASVYRGYEIALYPSVGAVLEKVFVSWAAIVLLGRGYGVVAVAAVMVIGAALNAGWQWFFLRRLGGLRRSIRLSTVKTLLAGAVPFFLSAALAAVYFRLDIVLLAELTDASVVGWYGAAYRLFDALFFLPYIVSDVILFPVLARLSLSSRAGMRTVIAKGMDIVLTFGVPMCVGLFVLAKPLIRFIYQRPEFDPAIPVLRWLSVALFLLCINAVLNTVVVVLDMEKKLTVLSAVMIVANLGLNWWIIPLYRHVGAAAVTVVTELIILLYLLAVIPRSVLPRSSVPVLAKASVAAVGMAVVLFALRGQSIVVLIPVGAVAYLACALPLRIVPPEDIRFFRQTLRRGRPGDLPEPEAAGSGY